MATLAELTAQIIAARVTRRDMTTEELQQEIKIVSALLKNIDTEGAAEASVQEAAAPQKINLRKVFKEKEVFCLLCNKGFKTLKRHLTMAHKISEKEYKKRFGIPAKQPLVARAYSEERRKATEKLGLSNILAAARATRAAKKAEAAQLMKKQSAPAKEPAKPKTKAGRKQVRASA